MDKQPKPLKEVPKRGSSRQPNFTQDSFKRHLKASERSNSLHQPDAAPERKPSIKTKTSENGNKKSQEQHHIQHHRQSGQDRSSSHSGTLHVSQSWQLKKEIPITPKSSEGSSNRGTNTRTRLRGGGGSGFFFGSNTNIENKSGTVIYGKNTVNIHEDSSSHQQPTPPANASGS
jgi:hypothetical protein